MKRALAILLVTAMSCGAASVVQGEEQGEKAQNVKNTVKFKAGKATMMPAPEVQLQRLTEGLKLTDEQQKQIRPLLDDEYLKLKVIQRNENASPKQIQKQVEKLRGITATKMHAFMTPEQIEKHEMVSKEIKANKQLRMRQNRKARIGAEAEPPPPVSN